MDRLRGERVKNKNKVQKNERLRENQKFFILKFMTGSFFQPRKFAEKRSEKVPDGPGVCDVCDDAISGDFDDDDVTSCGVAFVSMNLIACSSVSRPLATTLSPT